MNLDELSKMRIRCDQIRSTLKSQFPISSPADWLKRAGAQAKWHVAFSYTCLPSIGEEISACLSIFSEPSSASVSWEHRWGLVADPTIEVDQHKVGFASGHFDAKPEDLPKLQSAAQSLWKVGSADISPECYDGIPVSLTVTAHPFTEIKTASCNIYNTVRDPAGRLARLVVGLIGCCPGRSQ